MRSRRISAAFLLALVAVLGAVGAGQAAESIGVKPGPTYEFSKTAFRMDQGEVPVFVADAEGDFHNVTAKTRGPDGRPLFRSRTIRTGTAPVEGAQYLTADRYRFECTIHGGMEADLVVGTAGTPKARPRVAAVVVRQGLSRVRETGRLRVRLRSPTGAKDLAVTARGAGALLARQRGVTVRKGVARVLRLRVTRRGRNALAGRRTARVSVRVFVPFGSPATAARTLRGG